MIILQHKDRYKVKMLKHKAYSNWCKNRAHKSEQPPLYMKGFLREILE